MLLQIYYRDFPSKNSSFGVLFINGYRQPPVDEAEAWLECFPSIHKVLSSSPDNVAEEGW